MISTGTVIMGEKKYAISTLFEDATDVMDTDPVTSSYFLNNGISYQRAKERIKFIEVNYSDTGKLIAAYYRAGNFTDRYGIAKMLVEKTIGEYGFFEWESGQD